MPGAIAGALRERIAREKRLRGVDGRAQTLLAIGERCARRLRPGPSATEHGDVLYDERGVPEWPSAIPPAALHLIRNEVDIMAPVEEEDR